MLLGAAMNKRRRMSRSISNSNVRERKSLRISKLLLDRKNVKLLRLLCTEPRASISELARRMAMSAPAVRERVLKLQLTGVITRWRVDLDPAAVGYPVLAYVRVMPMPGQLPKIA